MKHLEAVLEDYLSRVGRLGELGLGEESKGASTEDSNYLAKILDQKLQFNKLIVVAIMICLGVLFVVATSIVVWYRHDVRAFYAIFGLLLLSNFGIIKWLRQLWWEMNIMDISLSVVRELPPDEAAAFISHLYWDFLRGSPSSRLAKPKS